MEEEIWYDVPNYEGYYQCSNALRFRSLERTMIKSDGHKRIDKSRLMTIRYGKRGELSNTFGAKNWSAREVIDLNTNKIYDCIKNASIELGLPYALTRQRLNRNRLWLTNLRYV